MVAARPAPLELSVSTQGGDVVVSTPGESSKAAGDRSVSSFSTTGSITVLKTPSSSEPRSSPLQGTAQGWTPVAGASLAPAAMYPAGTTITRVIKSSPPATPSSAMPPGEAARPYPPGLGFTPLAASQGMLLKRVTSFGFNSQPVEVSTPTSSTNPVALLGKRVTQTPKAEAPAEIASSTPAMIRRISRQLSQSGETVLEKELLLWMRGGTLGGKPLTAEEAGLVLPRPGWLKAMTAEALKEAETARAEAIRAIEQQRRLSSKQMAADAMQPMKVTIKMPPQASKSGAGPAKVVMQAPTAAAAAAAAAAQAAAAAKSRQQNGAVQQRHIQAQAQSKQLMLQQQELQHLHYLRQQQAMQQQQAQAAMFAQQEYWPYGQTDEWGLGVDEGVDAWAMAADQWSACAAQNTQLWHGNSAMWQQTGMQPRAGKGGKVGKGRGKGKGKSKALAQAG
mmetsp:Transcript_34945/g.78559  ORF Transcript_34945/g.78559 Transcript_34945/m.78559 type:complete len:450 (-) Transcript_34945:51-1400(-)